MKKLLLMTLLCAVMSILKLNAQVTVTATAATVGPTVYTTLGAALSAVNAGTHQGVITIDISASTTEAGPCILNGNAATPASYTSVVIRPSVDGVTISGPTATGRGLIELKGSSNVTIDGDNPNTGGINRNLTITNTAANTITFTSCIRIATVATVAASANNIIIRNCALNGSATGRNLAAATSTTGSENTTFGIYAGGNGGATAVDAPTAIANVTTATAPAGTTINNLLVDNNAINACARGVAFLGANVAVAPTLNITNNLIGDQNTLAGNPPYTTPTTTVYTKGIFVAGAGSINITGNSIKTVVSYVGIIIAGIEVTTAATTPVISNNTIAGIVLNTNSGNPARGISLTASTNPYTISGNSISNVQNFCSSATTSNQPSGIYLLTAATSGTVEKNTITKVIDRNTGTFGVAGVIFDGGSNITFRNNFISDINQDMTGGAAFSQFGVHGIRITAGTGHKIYNNSISMQGTLIGTATTNQLTSCLFIQSTALTGIDVRNNIFFNQMTGGSTSIAHVSIFLPSGATSALNLTLNNNAYYCGTTAASQGIAQVGTTAGTGFFLPANFNAGATTPASNLRFYTSTLSVATTNDNTSLAGAIVPAFISATNLHIPAATVTPLESGGASIGVTTDIDNDARPGPVGSVNGGAVAPDIGADEFDGVPVDAFPPSITYTPLTPSCSPGDRTLSGVVVTDVAGIPIVGANVPRIYYKKGVAGTYFSQPGTLVSGNANNSTWSFTIVASDMGGLITGDQVFYYVIAQDITSNISSNPAGAVATNVNTVTTPPSTPNSFLIQGTMSGTFTVGVGGNFTTLTAAVNAYNTSCLGGPVVFNLIDATYPSETFPITINANALASAVNTLTIQPATGNTATITGSSATGIIILNGADFVTINGSNTATVNSVCPLVAATRNLTIANTSVSTSSAVVWLGNTVGNDPVTNCTVQNCIITGNAATTTLIALGAGGATIGTGSAVQNNNLTFTNNDIRAAAFGIYSSGPSAALKNQNLTVNQNTMTTAAPNNIAIQGIALFFTNNVTVSGNVISNMANAASTDLIGINVGFTPSGASTLNTTTGIADCASNITITNNTIGSIQQTGTFSAVGIAVANTVSGTTLIANNMVYGVMANATPGDFSAGIVLGGGTATTNVYHNTVAMQGTITGASSATATSACLAVTAASVMPLDVRNNVFTNTQIGNAGSTTRFTAIALGYTSTVGNYASLVSNYNDLFVAGAGPGTYQVGITNGVTGGTSRTTLANWQAETGRDANSSNVTATYVSSTNLHMVVGSNPSIEDAGTPIVSITTDFDCATRNNCLPDMGADEFGAGPAEVNVVGNSVTIVDGDVTPSPTDHTSFGTTSVCNGTVSRTYTIQNTGGSPLTISSVTITGTNPGDFTVTTPAVSPVAAAGSTTLVVTFDPSVAGVRSAIITINNSDCDEAAYDFTVAGQGTQIVASAGSQANLNCNGDNSGSASVSVVGGVAPITYAWAPSGGTAAAAFGLSAQSYTCTATDANGCTSQVMFTITEPTVLTASLSAQTDVACNGSSTGAATVTASGGTGSFSYAWAPSGGSSATASGLAAGSYTCTVTDANTCSTTVPVIITEPSAITSSISSQTNVACNGGATGSATVFASGGAGSFTYAWAPSGGSAATESGLAAGSYTCTITDANGCGHPQVVVITQPSAVTVTISSQTDAACNTASTGSATASASGGTGAFTYAWTSGGTAATESGLAAGSYTCTATDVNGCTGTVVAVITEPSAITSSISASTNVSCNGGSNGSATVSASGGTGAFTYAWAPTGGTAATATGLALGSYTCTITDANSCTHTQTVSITEPTAITSSVVSSTNVSCNGGSNGAATVSASGGTGAFTYAWAPAGGTAATATGLAFGTYTCTITDANACTHTQTVSITQPTAITSSVASSTNVSCNGGSNGSATVSASGGTGALTYAWAPTGGTAATATGLAFGTYTCTITDANSCTHTQTVSITEPSAITSIVSSVTDATCGNSNGDATVTPSGGTGVFTYSWTSGGTAATETGLAAGSYTCTITDANGCTHAQPVSINNIGGPVVSLASQTDVSCNAGNNGSATVSATGVATLTYAWAPTGGTAATGTGLTAGSYTCTVTDGNGCIQTQTVTITQPSAITSSISAQTNVSCNGGSNGSATVSASGGTGALTYAWAPTGGTTATASGLTFGTYTCTITDANACTRTQTVSITQPTAITSSISASTNVSCNGGANGSATVSASGGTGVLTYAWAPTGGTAATASGLTFGTYTCTITDANACTRTQTVSITQPTAITSSIASSTNVSCNGGANGSATVSASGGTGVLTYAWAPTGGTAATASGLTFGTYTCTITDANACTRTQTVSITQPTAITSSIAAQTNVSCNGGSNGSATVSASGGTGVLTYAWAPTGGTTATASGLTFGTYTCTITDANACTRTQTVSITQPTAITSSIASSTNVSCNGGSNGSATVSASGGTGVLTYAWAPTGGTAATASGLTFGTYTCTITDANACTRTQTVSITQPTAITSSISASTNVSCNGGANGSATVSASGGTGVLTYSWAPTGGTAATASGLTFGTYTCTITDANACTRTQTVSITQPTAITSSIVSSTNVSCNGGANGSATVSASGGTGVLTYSWAPTGGTAATASGLTFGTYTCTITDANACTRTQTVSITQPTAITSSIASSTNVSCNGGANGSATVSASGGTGVLTYAWAPTGGTAATASGLTFGTYTCTITDANACTRTQTVSITQPTAITSSIASSTNVSCNGGANGSATVSASGGTGVLTYSWAPTGGTAATASGLTFGTYTCTITDANACTRTQTVSITQPTAITSSISASTNVSCNGGSNGSATVSASGGTGVLTYAWAPTGGTAATASGLTFGTYTCTITDANACTRTQTVSITQPSAITSSIAAQTNITCNGGSNGSATVSASGGTGVLTYAWTPTGGTAATASGLTSGIYTCTITDANACTRTQTVNITQPSAITSSISAQTNISCNGGSNGSATVSASGGTGVLTYAWAPTGGTAATASGLTSGTYTCTITDANSCTHTQTVSITQPTVITASISSQTNVTCNGGSNGSATVAASGGTGVLTYSWTPTGGTAATASGLMFGTYTCTITDANGCTRTQTVSITQPFAINSSVSSVTNATCGSNNGSATISASGGTGVLTYSWAPTGGTAATASGIGAGGYTVTITDAAGCTHSQFVAVSNSSGPTVAVTASTNVTCFGGNNGAASVTAFGGTGLLTYDWTGSPAGDGTPSITGLTQGTYICLVTDQNGCVGTATVNITEPSSIASFVSAQTNVSCNGGNNGSATVSSSGGTGMHFYSWSSGGNTATETGLAMGTYTVTITDMNGCTHSQLVTITEPTPVVASVTASTNVTCFGGNDGAATVTASGGTGTLTYSWAPAGGTAATATGLVMGTYTCTVTDVNGCSLTATVSITEPIQVAVTANVTADTVCFGTPVTFTGSGAATSYTWTGGVTDAVPFTPTVTDTYTVTGMDATGCTNTATVTVLVNALPSVTANATSVAACSTDSVTFTGSGSSTSYTWSGGVTDGAPFEMTASGTFTVTGTDANGCVDTASIAVTVNPLPIVNLGPDQVSCPATIVLDAQNPGDTYLWLDSTTTQTLSATSTGVYWVDVTNTFGCTVRDSVMITINPNPVVALGADTAICSASVTLDAGNAGATYLWLDSTATQTFTANTSGLYAVTVTLATGCVATDSINIVLNPAVVVTLGADSVQCGGTITLDAGSFANGTYLWLDSTSLQTLTAGTSGNYSVVVTDSITGCSGTDSINVTINAIPAINLGTDTVQCGGTVVLSAHGGLGYLWSDSTMTQTLTVSTSGNYWVVVTDTATGCSATDSVNVTINALPNVTFLMSLTTICDQDADLALSGSPAGGTFTGPGVTGTNFDPSSLSGSQTVVYAVTDTNGCTGTASDNIIVDPCTGTIDNVVTFGMNVYPNPNYGHFYVELNYVPTDVVTIEVTNALGQVVRMVQTTTSITELDIEMFEGGVYNVRVIDGGTIFVGRIVKE